MIYRTSIAFSNDKKEILKFTPIERKSSIEALSNQLKAFRLDNFKFDIKDL